MTLAPIRALNAAIRRLAAATHWLQYKAEGALLREAEWFDHEIDVHWRWPRRSRGEFLERGVLSAIAMHPDDRVLELCSGDGFFAQRFYAPRVASLLALDHNAAAIGVARRVHAAPNVRYELADITCDMPDGPFDRVIWNTALSHFSDAEIEYIAGSVAASLAPGGVLSGHIDFEPGSTYRYLKSPLDGPADLAAHLTPHFAHVAVLESHEPQRSNLYFFASDDRAAILVSERHPAVSYWSQVPATQDEQAPTGRFQRGTAAADATS